MNEGIERIQSIRDALTDCGFDWGSGSVSIVNLQSDTTGLVKVQQGDPRLDRRGPYLAVDGNHYYLSAFIDMLGTKGIFPAKLARNSVETIEINLVRYFDGDPHKDLLINLVGDIEIISAVDVQNLGKGACLNVVGSRDIPFFVVALTEKEAIRLFMERLRLTARAFAMRQNMMVALALAGHGKGPKN